MGISMFAAGTFSHFSIENTAVDATAKTYGGAAVFFIFLFTAIFGATWLTVPWLYPAEIFPLEVRAKGNAWGVVGWSLGNGMLTLLCPSKYLFSLALCIFVCMGYKKLTNSYSNVLRSRLKNAIYFRHMQYNHPPHGILFLSRNQPTHPRRN